MHITKFAILSAVVTPKHLFIFSPPLHVKPTHYVEMHKLCVVTDLGSVFVAVYT